MTKQLNEGLKYMDMEHMVSPILGIDQYKSTIGKDDDVITLDFTVKGKQVGDDLSEWLEKGYDWVIDGDTSPGEVKDGKFLVFAEINRRQTAPARIIEMIEDLETLTGIKIDQWKIKIKDQVLPATEENIKKNLETSPHEYRVEHEQALNEWREIAGIKTVSTYNNDEDMKAMKRRAGIY